MFAIGKEWKRPWWRFICISILQLDSSQCLIVYNSSRKKKCLSPFSMNEDVTSWHKLNDSKIFEFILKWYPNRLVFFFFLLLLFIEWMRWSRNPMCQNVCWDYRWWFALRNQHFFLSVINFDAIQHILMQRVEIECSKYVGLCYLCTTPKAVRHGVVDWKYLHKIEPKLHINGGIFIK